MLNAISSYSNINRYNKQENNYKNVGNKNGKKNNCVDKSSDKLRK